MITVYDRRTRKKIAVLDTDKGVIEDAEINSVTPLTFSVPGNDPGVSKLRPMNYVRWSKREDSNENSPLYRILAPGTTTDDYAMMHIECEHVIATLVDDVLFGAFTIGGVGVYTDDVIRWLLSKQTVQNWILGECDFRHQFEYGWENENILSSLFSVPSRFTDPYMWVFDTTRYPWVISLKRIDINQDPQFFVRAGKNLISSKTEGSVQDVCTRLYGLGYGEGVNQLKIDSVNDGRSYVDAPQSYIDEYGLISRIFVDRRFEDAQSLKDRMLALLSELKEPTYSRTISVADLYELTKEDFDKAEIGRIVLLTDDDTKTYITGIKRNYDAVGSMEITLSSKPTDIASSMADLADRQRIEAVYSQGATQIYAHSVQANATPTKGAILKFYIPEEMRIINSVKSKIVLDQFRSYSKSTQAGGEITQTSSSGGESTQTSSSGGNGSTTASSGGGAAVTSAESLAAEATSGVVGKTTAVTGWDPEYRTRNESTAEGVIPHYHLAPRHYHKLVIPAHAHTVNVPAHSHGVSLPGHSHSVSLPSHAHDVTFPAHTHDIEQGIFEFGNATAADIYVNGSLKATMEQDVEIDLTNLLLDTNGSLPRGSWLEIEIRPNDLAYVCADLFVQGFIQSRGESVY